MARTAEQAREIMAPEQAADYLQVDRETIYRYIRDGKLPASRLGRTFRIPRASIETLFCATRSRGDIRLREFSREQIERFIEDDKLPPEADTIVRRFDEDADAD